MIMCPRNSKINMDASKYFERLWNNKDVTYTVPYKKYKVWRVLVWWAKVMRWIKR